MPIELLGPCNAQFGETERRREKQMVFNKKHGITPKGIKKKVFRHHGRCT